MAIDMRRAKALFRRDDLSEALQLCGSALAEDPDHHEAMHLIALIHLSQGHVAEPRRLIRQAIELAPRRSEYHASLSEVHRQAGDHDLAIASLREACRLAPKRPEYLCNLGASLVDRGDLDDAIDCYRAALAIDPGIAVIHSNLGDALMRKGDRALAREHLLTAIRLDPSRAEPHASLGKLLLEGGEVEASLAQCLEAFRLQPFLGAALINLGNVLDVVGRLEEAEACFRRAITIQTHRAEAYAGLAGVLEQRGGSDESIAALRQAVAYRPDHTGALARLATRLKGRLPIGERLAIEQILTRENLPAVSRWPLQYGLAQVYDGLGKYGRAAELSIAANATQGAEFIIRGRGYDPARHEQFVDDLIATFTPEFFGRIRGMGLDSRRPVFVVGVPRSGTSLVEQILASHPRVFGAGELRLLQDVFDALLLPDRPLVHRLAPLDSSNIQAIGSMHLEALAKHNATADRVVDKMPENTLNLGLISAIFPNAAIIHCRRDPRDIALSCWMTDFRAIRWANVPEHIASRIVQSGRLMDHWRRTLPTPILDVDYEVIVDDLEGTARRLIDHCGLEWDPACLDFHKTKRPVKTASVDQVRRPIYRSSIGRWEPYRELLAPLFTGLGEAPA